MGGLHLSSWSWVASGRAVAWRSRAAEGGRCVEAAEWRLDRAGAAGRPGQGPGRQDDRDWGRGGRTSGATGGRAEAGGRQRAAGGRAAGIDDGAAAVTDLSE
jgi:hypothetical protein